MPKIFKKLFLAIVFGLAIIFRLIGLNWDQSHHLHPDERFLTMVNMAQQLPKNLAQYQNPKQSPLNPYNQDYDFFVYGRLPLNLNKFLAVIFQNDSYHKLALQGRFLTALADILTLVFVYQLAKLIEKKLNTKKFKHWAVLIYASAVLPIQQAHFFTVDSFLNLFITGSLFFALKASLKALTKFKTPAKKLIRANWAMSAIFFGLALACKISAVYLLPLILALMALGHKDWLVLIKKRLKNKTKLYKLALSFLLKLASFGFLTYITLRLTDPYFFENANWFNPSLSSQFLQNIKQLQAMADPQGWFPPSVQWLNKPVWFAGKNMILYGLGLPVSLLALIGLFSLIKKLLKTASKLSLKNLEKTFPKTLVLLVLIWGIAFFIYQSSQFTKSVRYFLFLYPWLALIAGWGVAQVQAWWHKICSKKICQAVAAILLIVWILSWPLMFISIYLKDHSRITASKWIYQNIPKQSVILAEYWDDALPLGVKGRSLNEYQVKQIAVFDQDQEQKWQKLHQELAQADYYILSSNRAWGSISQATNRYPVSSEFYLQLLSGSLTSRQVQKIAPFKLTSQTNYHYQKVAEFTSFPSLKWLGVPITIPDQQAEEAFTVYDHPKVMIYENIQKN